MMDAAADNKASIVEILLDDYNADYPIRDNDGFTALHYCTWREGTESVRLLLDRASKTNKEKFNIFLNRQGPQGQTALMDAEAKKRTDFVDLFLNTYSATYNVRDDVIRTVL